jgi:hypothetical protein
MVLSWLWRRRERPEKPALVRGTPSAVSVAFDADTITLKRPGELPQTLNWVELASVGIVTTEHGPFATDLFWLLQSRDRSRSLIVPMDATGEHELLKAMQARLPGFDNMAVVEAMGSIDNAGFVIWEAGPRKP